MKRLIFCLGGIILPLFCLPLFAATIGDKSPHCVMTSSTNAPINLTQYQRKVVYVDFWASWCPSCMQSFPFLNQLLQEYGDKAFSIVGVNLDEQHDDAQAFLAHHPTKFTITNHGGEQCAKMFDVQAMPTAYLIDKHGVIRHIQMGFRAGEVDELKSQIAKLLAEK